MSNGHALLSPSSAHRWLVCTPSARIEAEQPDRPSEAAAEGTLAHSISEILIRQEILGADAGITELELQACQADPLYSEAMLEDCYTYADFVAERYHSAKDPVIFLEDKLDLREYAPECTGTGDVVLVTHQVLEMIDLKYGKGVLVNAARNKQLMLYGLGAYLKYGFLYDITIVRLTIYQPRIQNFSSWDISTDELLRWAIDELRPLAAKAYAGEGDLVAGDHCRFCRIAATCRANAARNQATAAAAFQEPVELTPEEISTVLTGALALENWLTAVKEYALDQAVNHGTKWPGLKLVEGTARRIITSTDQAAVKLIQAGHQPEDIYKPKALRALGELEKLAGKKKLAELLTGILVKPEGKPTLAPLEDKRPAWHSATAAAGHFTTEKSDD